MKYVALFIALIWGLHTYAQPSIPHFPPGSEKYYCLDTNKYFVLTPLAQMQDTFAQLEKTAEAAGDFEFALTLKLYTYVKAYRERQVNFDTTEYRILKLASEANEKNLKRLEADAIQVLGEFYGNDNQQSAAIEQYLSAYSIYKNFKTSEYPQKQNYLYSFGLMYYKYLDYANAVNYLNEALYIDQTNSGLFSPIANTLGLCYRNMALYDSAIVYFQRVYDNAGRKNDPVWIGISQGNIGITYFYQKKYTEAVPLLKIDIETSIANSNIKNAVSSMVTLATIYSEQNKNDESEALLLRAIAFCHAKSFWQDWNLAEKIFTQLYRIYSTRQKYQLAHLYADSALIAKDSAMARFSALAISRTYERQNFIKKKLAAEKHQSDKIRNQLKEIDQQQLLYKFIIGFLIVVLIVAVIVNRFRGDLKNIATSKLDAPEIVVQKMSIVIISIATCAAALVWTGLYYYYYGICLITALPFSYFLIVGPALIIYFFTKKQQLLVNVQLFCIFFITLVIEVYSGGYRGGVVILWACLAPVGALMYKGIKNAAVWMLLFIIAIICLAVFHEYLAPSYHPIPETAQFMFICMNILGPVIVIYFSMQFFVKSVIRDGRLLQENNTTLSNILGELKTEKQKSDDLLLNILPGEIADELKASGSSKARHFENVTVLFTDFANFTATSERMGAQQLIDELDTCFKAFDEITASYNIEKIKTIGDAYLAIAGLPTPDLKHAENVVRAAKEINQYMVRRLTNLGRESTFEVRIGIHSGSVVAGIVGIKKFAYDIWGDTVNTAARMEQNCEAGKINISETTYELVKDKITCEFRGEIEAKGKGQLKMYYVSAGASA
jgi:class 3 adenylate cyclase